MSITYNDLTLTVTGGASTEHVTVDEINGKAFILFDDFLQISVVDLTPDTPGETELIHASLSFGQGDTISNSFRGALAPPMTVGSDGYLYAVGENTSNYTGDTPTVVQSTTSQVDTITLTGVAAGNQILVIVAYNAADNGLLVDGDIIDNFSQTYTHFAGGGSDNPGNNRINMWYAPNVVGGTTTVTVNFPTPVASTFTITMLEVNIATPGAVLVLDANDVINEGYGGGTPITFTESNWASPGLPYFVVGGYMVLQTGRTFSADLGSMMDTVSSAGATFTQSTQIGSYTPPSNLTILTQNITVTNGSSSTYIFLNFPLLTQIQGQRLYKIDPTTLAIVGSATIPAPLGAGSIQGLSAWINTNSGHPLIAVTYEDAFVNFSLTVFDGSLITTLGGTTGVVGTQTLGVGTSGQPYALSQSYPVWDDAGNVYVFSTDSATNGYITQSVAPGYTTNNQYAYAPDGSGSIPLNGIYDSGTNSLLVLISNTDGPDFTSTVGEIAQWDITTHVFTGLNVGASPASPVYDINQDIIGGIIVGNVAGQRGHSLSGTFYLTDPADNLSPFSSLPSGDLFNPWTASTLVKGSQVDISAGFSGQSTWGSPASQSAANAFYNNSDQQKYMFLPDPISPHFYIAALSGGVVVVVPTVTTQAASSITPTTATGNGNITSLGGAANCTAEGFVFDTSSHTLPGNVAPGSSGYADHVSTSGTFTTGPFTGSLTGLTASTTYYVRAFAQNSAGYAYGNEVNFASAPEPPPATEAVIAIPFSIRETTAVTLFASLEIAWDLLKMGKVYPITLLPVTIGQVALVQAEMFSTYKQLIHQDVPDQHNVLHTLCTESQTEIDNLASIVAGIPVTGSNATTLSLLYGRLKAYTDQMIAVLTHFPL